VTTPADPRALLRSRDYLRLLALAAILGVPVSAAAYGFLALVSYLQKEIFTHLPHGLGFATEPIWWPLPVLVAGGIIAGLAIRYLPGRGGPSPAGGFAMHGAPAPGQLPGILLAALATLVFGAVLGPEMPLILAGGGLALLAVRLSRRDVPQQAAAVLAASGSFAALRAPNRNVYRSDSHLGVRQRRTSVMRCAVCCAGYQLWRRGGLVAAGWGR
jgi:H+/Cl- antiporter ClcA